MKPSSQITDRAKRYRANQLRPAGPRRCNFCGQRKNIDVDHIGGDESDGAPENLLYLCRPCNTAKGITQKRNRIGIRTRQYNPTRPTFEGWREAAAVLTGNAAGDVAAATHYVRATPIDKRLEFAAKLAKNPPTFQQYSFGAAIHQRGAHDEGGAIIHATPPALRKKYAKQIAETKRSRGTAGRRSEVPF